MPGPWLLFGFLTFVMVVALTACGRTEAESGRELDGPLIALAEEGGQSLLAPKAEEWWASYGGLPVCTEGPEVTIDGVRLISDDEPLAMRAYVYRPEAGEGYLGVRGAAPDWAEPYASFDDPTEDTGSYAPVPGAVVSETCDDGTPEDPGPRVVPVMKTGPEGLRAQGFWIDYSIDGRKYTVKMPWEIVLCGSKQPRRMCDMGERG